MEYKFLSYCTIDELKMLKKIIEGKMIDEKDKILEDIKCICSSKTIHDYDFCCDSIPYYQENLEEDCNNILKQLDF